MFTCFEETHLDIRPWELNPNKCRKYIEGISLAIGIRHFNREFLKKKKQNLILNVVRRVISDQIVHSIPHGYFSCRILNARTPFLFSYFLLTTNFFPLFPAHSNLSLLSLCPLLHSSLLAPLLSYHLQVPLFPIFFTLSYMPCLRFLFPVYIFLPTMSPYHRMPSPHSPILGQGQHYEEQDTSFIVHCSIQHPCIIEQVAERMCMYRPWCFEHNHRTRVWF